MELKLYQIDAFASRLFEGNPAAVCPLEQWLPDRLMQAIAAENNLSETAFFVPDKTGYQIRWFTPNGEVDLCGHATLASAYVLFNLLGYQEELIEFSSRSGVLLVGRDKDYIVMDFPAQPPVVCEPPEPLKNAFTITPTECLRSKDYILVFERESDVELAKPDLGQLAQLDLRGVIITSTATRYDFIARFFGPKYGIPEDPVTGSAYTQLAPYWAEKLDSTLFHVKQVSPRGGELTCELVDDRVLISGKALQYMEGTIYLKSSEVKS